MFILVMEEECVLEMTGDQGLDYPVTPGPEEGSLSAGQSPSPTGVASTNQEEERTAERSSRHSFRMMSLSSCEKEPNQLDNILRDNHRRDIQMAMMFSVVAVPILASVILLAISLSHAVDSHNLSHRAKMDIDQVFLIDDLITNLQVERGMTATFLSSNGACPESLLGFQHDTDQAVRALREWNGNIFFGSKVYSTRFKFMALLYEHRKGSHSRSVEAAKSMKFYTEINNVLMNWVNTLVVLPENGNIWPRMVTLGLILRASDAIGTQRALGAINFLVCGQTPESMSWFTQQEGAANILLELANVYYYESFGLSLERFGYLNVSDSIQTQTDQIHSVQYSQECATFDDATKTANSERWFDEVTSYIEHVKAIRETLRHNVIVLLDEMVRGTDIQVVIYIVIIVVIATVSLVFGLGYIIYLRKMSNKISTYVRQIADKSEDLAREQKRSDALLYRMLPKSVAKQLKFDKQVKAEFYSNVTIVISDIVGFTAKSARSTPMQVVDMLNKLYSLFDTSIDRYDVYKVETIGDSYVVVSGVPNPNDNHAAEIAQLALELLSKVSNFRLPQWCSETIQLRLGIHTGTCMAGVVGKKMPRYCLFGDTVNTASTMESSSEAGKIHISESTHAELERIGGFVMVHTATRTMMGGDDPMTTYWLLGVDKELIMATSGSRISIAAD